MKQRTALYPFTRLPSLASIFVFSLVASPLASLRANAQNINEGEVSEATSESTPSLVESNDVVVPAGLRGDSVDQDAIVRRADRGVQTQRNGGASTGNGFVPSAGTGAPSTGFTFSAPSTGIGGSNPGNANTGGVQLQTVNVQANPTSASNAEQALSANRAEMLRRERSRREIENEGRLLERVEEARLNEETERSKTIDGFSAAARASATATSSANGTSAQANASASANAGTVETVNVSPVGATAVAVANASANSDNRHDDYGSRGIDGDREFEGGEVHARYRNREDSKFRLAPFAGYRWYADNNTVFKARNLIVAGVGLEGRMNRYVSLEGSFTYGRDDFRVNTYGVGGGYGGGGYGGGYANYGYGNAYASPYGATYPGAGIMARSRDSYEIMGSIKLHPMSNNSVFRPYAVVGIGGLLQSYNFNDSYTTAYLQALGLQGSTRHVIGDFGAGVDFEVANNMTIGSRFDFQPVWGGSSATLMRQMYGDAKSRYRLVGNLQLSF